ncbi:MAG TPA: hypothetical protein VEQ59_09035 [Polyangiaceae bacterium]|nr:hypothetical protein [Polyangiaceae bacterium]
MSQLWYRGVRVLAAASICAFCFACGSDQKSPNTADDQTPPPEPATDSATPTPSDVTQAPTGEPTNVPPRTGPPQGLNEPEHEKTEPMPK